MTPSELTEKLARDCAIEMDGDPIRAKVIRKYLATARRDALEEAARRFETVCGHPTQISDAIRALAGEQKNG